jgi:hypothetical protein
VVGRDIVPLVSAPLSAVAVGQTFLEAVLIALHVDVMLGMSPRIEGVHPPLAPFAQRENGVPLLNPTARSALLVTGGQVGLRQAVAMGSARQGTTAKRGLRLQHNLIASQGITAFPGPGLLPSTLVLLVGLGPLYGSPHPRVVECVARATTARLHPPLRRKICAHVARIVVLGRLPLPVMASVQGGGMASAPPYAPPLSVMVHVPWALTAHLVLAHPHRTHAPRVSLGTLLG